MYFEREATTAKYSEKRDLLHEEFAIPVGGPEWLQSIVVGTSATSASEAFWNRVENFEERLDAQLARDVMLALPIELTSDQNIALVREFVEQHVLANGMVADWVYHNTPGNPHVHLMMTFRPLTVAGFGLKEMKVVSADGTPRRRSNGRIAYRNWVGDLRNSMPFATAGLPAKIVIWRLLVPISGLMEGHSRDRASTLSQAYALALKRRQLSAG